MEKITKVTTKQQAADHLERQGVDVSEASEDLQIKELARENGFIYPNFRPDLDRVFGRQGGDASLAGQKLIPVPEVNSKEKAADHLESIGVEAGFLRDLDDENARIQARILSFREGYSYANYSP